ncbi:MAG: nucleotidyl transferase AbiEii/AbiGii toxin family protein [Patescibacteria group bacterium]
MHKEILTKTQIQLLPLAAKFIKNFGLVGGTAIALQIGHRRSVDFDLFALKQFDNASIRKIVIENGQKIDKALKDEAEQFTFLVNGVQFTFLYYPFNIKFSEKFENIFKMPNLLTLAAMKAYALGRRAKWKDYVDLYFIINKYHSIEKIVNKGKEIFANEFNERIFREQLGYFDDMDYSEEVDFLSGQEVDEKKIKKKLTEFSLER